MTEFVIADTSSPSHAQAIVTLLDSYATDAMGGGETLSDFTKTNLVSELNKRPDYVGLLVFVDGAPAALVNCFENFSTFACKPILNIHDFLVAPEFRGKGLAKQMLQEVENLAAERGCCKMTLEVLQGNELARQVYEKFGFAAYELDPKMGHALFYEKKIDHSN